MPSVSQIIDQALQIPADTFAGKSARAISDSLNRLLNKRNPSQNMINLKINLLEQLIAAHNGTTPTILIRS